MANKKKLPKLSKRTENLENWLSEVTNKHNFVAMEVDRVNDDLVITRDRLDKLEKDAKQTNTDINELKKVIETVNKKAGLLVNMAAKDTQRVKSLQQGASQKQPTMNATGGNTIAMLAGSLNIIALSMVRINATISKSLSKKGMAGAVGAVPEAAPAPAATAPTSDRDKGKDGGIFGALKSLFMNPAVVAALAGIVYFVLPKDMQEKIKGMLGAFATGIEQGLGENEKAGLKGFNTAIKATGVAFATYLGAKMIASIAEAITISLKIVKMLGGGKLGRGAVIATGVAIGATALAARKMGDSDLPEDPTDPKESKPAQRTTQESAPSPSGSNEYGINPNGGGIGLKPGGGVGIKPPPENIKSVISEAAKRVGVDENVMMAMAQQESGFDPNASAKSSSAKGLFQFIDSSWNTMVSRYGDKYPELARGPYDPMASALAGALFIKENAGVLEKQGLPVNGTNLYALHFLGPGGGPKLIKADPNAIAADIFPQAASANKTIFYTKDGQPKTVAEVMSFLYGKVGALADAYASGKGPSITTASTAPSTSGEQVSTLSYGVKKASSPTQTASINNVNNSKNVGTENTKGDDNLIPSPIAARGSLHAYTKHITAYG